MTHTFSAFPENPQCTSPMIEQVHDGYHEAALHNAVRSKNTQIVKELLQYNPNPTLKNSAHKTPLSLLHGQLTDASAIEIGLLLLQHGAHLESVEPNLLIDRDSEAHLLLIAYVFKAGVSRLKAGTTLKEDKLFNTDCTEDNNCLVHFPLFFYDPI